LVDAPSLTDLSTIAPAFSRRTTHFRISSDKTIAGVVPEEQKLPTVCTLPTPANETKTKIPMRDLLL